jgi:hypothetical protein
MPVKPLPSNPSLDHLKYQAKDLLRAYGARDPQAAQRIREFHPRFAGKGDTVIFNAEFKLSDAQLTIARESGFQTWSKLRKRIETPTMANNLALPMQERIEDPIFRSAVDLLDTGNAERLRALLEGHSDLAHRRVIFEGGNYFQNPTLLEFVAENPVRHGKLPANIVEIAKVILEAGTKNNRRALNDTLALVCSGRVPRECMVQVPLIDLLCDHGADSSVGMSPALTHGEFEAVDALIRRGAQVDLLAAAATGRLEDAHRLLATANAEQRHRALALAALFGHTEIVRLLLDVGENPDRYNPVGFHAHSTPLHQAAFAGHAAVVHLLVERGAKLDIPDTMWQGTPEDWADHGGKTEIVAYLRRRRHP